MVKHYSKKYEPESLVSGAYLDCLKNSKKIISPDDVLAFCVQYVKQEVKMDNSETNLSERFGKYVNVSLMDSERTLAVVAGAEDWQDFEWKLDRYNRETLAAVVTESYKAETNDVIKLEVFEMFLNGYEKCRDMAAELGISKSSAHRLIDEMKVDVRRFAASCGAIM